MNISVLKSLHKCTKHLCRDFKMDFKLIGNDIVRNTVGALFYDFRRNGIALLNQS